LDRVNRGVRSCTPDRAGRHRRASVAWHRGGGDTDVDYRLDRRYEVRSSGFVHALSSALATTVVDGNRISALHDGLRFYPEMLAAIGDARRSIALECYIFHPGRTGEAFLAALTERARAGVHVRIILDAFGSRRLQRHHVQRLIVAGCQVVWHPRARWRRAHRLTNTTHREILVVDGRLAFTGGAGISDWWAADNRGRPPWRDTMVRVEGPVVASCQAVFAENWLECRGEILAGDDWFPRIEPCGALTATVVRNSPSSAGSRALFQALLECAAHELRLATPYFLPDPSFLATLIERARAGVSVVILVPGRRMDHPWVRLCSRRLFRQLLNAGARVFEYPVGGRIATLAWRILRFRNALRPSVLQGRVEAACPPPSPRPAVPGYRRRYREPPSAPWPTQRSCLVTLRTR
jgi:cardiolipin synthase